MTNVFEDHIADLELITLVCAYALSKVFNTDKIIGA